MDNRTVMDTAISTYIRKNKVLTLATEQNGQPYCAHCFYAYQPNGQMLIFLSDPATRHISEAIANQRCAGTISTNVRSVAKVKGIQFTGRFVIPDEDGKKTFYRVYYSRFPFARAHSAAIWAIRLDSIKMTDNTLGFGIKLTWDRTDR